MVCKTLGELQVMQNHPIPTLAIETDSLRPPIEHLEAFHAEVQWMKFQICRHWRRYSDEVTG